MKLPITAEDIKAFRDLCRNGARQLNNSDIMRLIRHEREEDDRLLASRPNFQNIGGRWVSQ